jgi:hypothetical protein
MEHLSAVRHRADEVAVYNNLDHKEPKWRSGSMMLPTPSASHTATSSWPASPSHGRDPSCHAETSDEPLGEQHVPKPLLFALLGLVILPVLTRCRAEQWRI